MGIETKDRSMSEGRALLTDREREALKTDESGSYRYKTRSYIRNRIERLEGDAELLAEHEPELFEQLQSAVCDTVTGRESQQEADSRESRGADRGGHEEQRPDSIREAAVAAVEDNWKESWDGHREDAVAALVGLYNRLDELPDGQQKGDFLGMYAEFEGPYPSDEYPDAGSEKGAWWREFVTECLDDLPGIERYGQNGRRWRNVGTDR